jgi:hypothetical protein
MCRLVLATAAAALLAACAELPPTPWPSPPGTPANPRYVGSYAETPDARLMSADLLKHYRVAGVDMPDKYFAELNAAADGPQQNQWLLCQNGPSTAEFETVWQCAANLAEAKAAQAKRAEMLSNLDARGVRKNFRLTADCTYGPDGIQTQAEMNLLTTCLQRR